MLGLGETKDEMYQAMDDLAANGLDILTLGQYLQPTKRHLEVAEFIHPDLFAHYREEGLRRGLKYVESRPAGALFLPRRAPRSRLRKHYTLQQKKSFPENGKDFFIFSF